MTLTEKDSRSVQDEEEEEDDDEGSTSNSAEGQDWKNLRKNFFILSTAGKPIYSLHGNEDKLVTTFGVMQALVSVVQSNDDSIRSITAGNTRFVFSVREPIILVCVSKTGESESQLTKQLNYLYNLLLSILTSTQLRKIYEERRNFDFRRLLTGSERLIDHLLNFMTAEPGFGLESVRCLPLDPSTRNGIKSNIVLFCSKIKKLVFALLIGNNQLISFVRMEKYTLDPVDMHILINLIDSTESFKVAESWTPICLPTFDPSGFLHAHVSYLADDCQACLVLLTVDKDIFFTLSEAKQKLVEKLRRTGQLEAINESLTQTPVGASAVDATDVRHFVYKNRQTGQYWCPRFEAPYLSRTEVERIYSLYLKMYEDLHTKNLKLILEQFGTETLFGWMNSESELYVIFEPLASKETIIKSTQKIMNWIKKEQDRLFMSNDSTF